MNAATLFGLNFLAYFIVFVLIVALVVLACKLGTVWSKKASAKVEATEAADANADTEA